MSQKIVSSKAVKAPARPAPPPPLTAKTSGSSINEQTTKSTQSQMPQKPASAPKKPPPPRPPPPKASAQLKAIQNAISFTGALQQSQQLTSSATAPDLLISWDSPPNSPTQGRWSSDALSLRSFGSDSSSTTTATGTFSTMTRSESGFESEPDLWGEASSTNSKIDKPFTMPTIIRPNRAPGKPPSAPAVSTHLKALEKVLPSTMSANCGSSADLLDLDTSDYSPPEPTIPPPPAPPIATLLSDSSSSAVAEPVPCALALYDYSSPHAGDLNFKEGDRIELLSKVNDEWLRGRVDGGAEGIFPLSYARIIVPLATSYRAVALYPFQAETDLDLGVQEGDTLEVTESKGNGWLYGRCCSTGRWGQFPEAFVQRRDL